MAMIHTVDFTKNPKQAAYYDKVMLEVQRAVKHMRLNAEREDQGLELLILENAIRYWFYGGAVRGGKTYLFLAILCVLCRYFVGSRWHVIRASHTDLLGTTIPSLEKIVKHTPVRWKKSQGDTFCEFSNGSRIYFKSEGYNSDKDLNKFKGLETNGVLLEQLEELQEETWKKALERTGSWYDCHPMAPALVFATFNPTYNWVKTSFHDKWDEEGCKPPFYYVQALPNDNAFVTQDQWLAWEQLDEETYNRFIKGIWDINVKGKFMTAFTEEHINTGSKIDPNLELWLSFDFNVDPMTCLLAQTDGESFLQVIREWRMPDSDTPALCEQILKDVPELYTMRVRITGDASGNNRNSGTIGHTNQYQWVQDILPVNWDDFRVPKVNPGIADSRTYCNSVLQRMKYCKVDEDCEHLINDLRFVLKGIDIDGHVKIMKRGMNKYLNIDNSQLGHLLDCYRYLIHNAVPNFVQVPKS